MTNAATAAPSNERSLLIVEDDKSFLQRLARAMETRGFVVTTAESVADGLLQVEKAAPAFAVVDMRLGDGNGLDVISAMKRRRPEARAIILTGYGNIATAVNALCFVDGAYSLDRFRYLLSGYEGVRTLSLAEWDAFPNELRFSSLRFTGQARMERMPKARQLRRSTRESYSVSSQTMAFPE